MTQSWLNWFSQTEAWIGGLGLASFLALFWVLRGAPLGQGVAGEGDPDAPRSSYRDRVVAAVALGITLIILGAFLALTRGLAWSIPAFGLGFATVVALVLINQKHRHASPTLKRTLDVSTAVVNAALFAGVLIVANVAAFRYGGRPFDMTREGAYSLASQTVNQLRSLKRPVTFTTFFGRSRSAFLQYDRVRQLLELYKAVNPEMVRLEHVDPFRDLARFEALAKRVPAVDVTQGGGVVLEYGDGDASDQLVVRNTDLFDVPRALRYDPDVNRFETTFKGEDAITSALIRLREAKRSRVVFTTGHGEPSVDDLEPNGPGLGVFKARLASTGFDVAAINPLTQEFPDDTAMVVVVAPRSPPFQPTEVARLKTLSDRKVPLLLLLGDSQETGLEAFLREFDLAVGKGFVIEPRLNVRQRVELLVVPVADPRHPILEPLDGQVVVFPRAAPLSVISSTGSATAPAAFVASALLRTSPESWNETDLNASRVSRDPTDAPGPFVIGATVTERPAPGDTQPPTPRLVLLGSRNVASNSFLQGFPSNLDLLMNSINWLRGRSELLGIEPKTHVALALTADQALRARLVLVPTVMSILLIITAGVTTYLARRN